MILRIDWCTFDATARDGTFSGATIEQAISNIVRSNAQARQARAASVA
jgi:hypothetical protein